MRNTSEFFQGYIERSLQSIAAEQKIRPTGNTDPGMHIEITKNSPTLRVLNTRGDLH